MISGLLFLLIANFIGGAVGPVLVKLGTSEIPLFLFTFLRFLIASIVFLPIFLKNKHDISRKNLKKLILVSILFVANALLFAIGIQQTTIIASQIIYSLVPLVVGFLAHFMLGEKFNNFKIIGAIISGAGIVVLITRSTDALHKMSLGTPTGNLLIFSAMICWSFYFVFSKKLSKENGPSTISFYSFLLTTVFLFPIASIDASYASFSFQDVSYIGYVSLFGTGIVASAVMFTFIQLGISRTSAYIASLFQYFAPVFAAITAVPLLHEKVTPNLILATALVTGGVFIATSLDKISKKLKKG